MNNPQTRFCSIWILALVIATPVFAADNGRIEGRLTHADGWYVAGVTVSVAGSSTVSDPEGRFALGGVAAGSHSLTLTFADKVETFDVEVEAGAVTRFDEILDWDLVIAETITVQAASRRRERIVDAPAAVSRIGGEEIARQAAHGQLPRLLRFSPGVDLAQSGVYDFSVNSRGFNNTSNNRLLVLVDGRNPVLPEQGGPRWAALSVPLEEYAEVELVRGPASALYGANAFNGVLNLVTRSPRDSQGGKARITAGELDTQRFDLRHAGRLGENGFFKLYGSREESDDFSRSRVDSVEYSPGLLPMEAVPVPGDPTSLTSLGLRYDTDFGGSSLSVESGWSEVEDAVILTGVGRLGEISLEFPWARFHLGSEHWSVLASYTERDGSSTALTDGGPSFVEAWVADIEVQGNAGFADGRGRLIGGVSYAERRVDSADPQGRQTAFAAPISAEHQAVFGQVDYDFTDKLRGALSLRFDDSDLHDSRVSPRAALVYAPHPRHSVRFSYGNAFRMPTFVELFIEFPLLPAFDLSGIEGALAPLLGGVPLGFGNVRALAVGNGDLQVEEIESFDLGYTGILGDKAFLTVSVFRNNLKDFATPPLPQLGTSLGRLNPNFGPYQPPAGLSDEAIAALFATLQGALGPLSALLSNLPDGSPAFILASFANFGEVDTEGLELGLTYNPRPGWTLDFSYQYFDFDTREDAVESPLLPNTPENTFSAAVSRVGERFDASLRWRWVEDFTWASGSFIGPVPSYNVVDLQFNYHLNDRWALGVDVANLLDDVHYEIFGGDLLERRALAHATVSW